MPLQHTDYLINIPAAVCIYIDYVNASPDVLISFFFYSIVMRVAIAQRYHEFSIISVRNIISVQRRKVTRINRLPATAEVVLPVIKEI